MQKKTGDFAKIAFEAKKKGRLDVATRNIIPNDAKLFAQADCEKAVSIYLSSDTESEKIYKLLRQTITPKFQFVNLNIPYHETFGVLDL